MLFRRKNQSQRLKKFYMCSRDVKERRMTSAGLVKKITSITWQLDEGDSAILIVFSGEIIKYGSMTIKEGVVRIRECEILDYMPDANKRRWTISEIVKEYKIHYLLEHVPAEDKELVRSELEKYNV